MSWGRVLRALLAVAVVAVCLFVLLRDVDLDRLATALSEARLELIPLSFLLSIISLGFRGERWRVLLRELDPRIARRPIYLAMFTGLFTDQILPAKGGEVVRTYALTRATPLSFLPVFGTVVIEKVFDVLCILLVCGAAAFAFAIENESIERTLQALLFASFLAGVALYLLHEHAKAWRFIALKIPHRATALRVSLAIRSLNTGIGTLLRRHRLVAYSLASVGLWTFMTLSFLPLLHAFDYGVPIPPYTVFVVLLFSAASLAVPSTPGGVGLVQVASYVALRLCLGDGDLSPESEAAVTAFGLLFHPIQIIPEVLIGLWAAVMVATDRRELDSAKLRVLPGRR